MKAVMFLSNAFTNDSRVYNEAVSLVKAGHEVTVIAWDREKHNPPTQNWDGIDVVRLRIGPGPKYGSLSWLWNGFRLLLWQRQAYGRALALSKERRFDVIHCHDLDTLSVGIRLKGKLGLPLIYDAHEIYGYMMTRTFGRRIANIFLWQEKRLMRKVDRIINVGEAQRRYFESNTDKPISVVMHCKPLRSLEYQPPNNEKFTVLYIGGLHKARRIPMLVRAVKGLPGVRCLIGGIGPPADVEAVKAESSKTANTAFLGRVPMDQVIPTTMKADIVFCMFSPKDANSVTGTPNKLFEAMVSGRPIICTRGTYSGELTEQEKVGLAVEYSEQALREAIIKLRDNPELRERLGRNALKAAINKYNWQKQEEKLLALYESLKRD